MTEKQESTKETAMNATMTVDHALLASWSDRRSETAFTELVQRHQSMVYNVCLRVLNNSSLADDATQATFILLSEKAGKLSDQVNLGGWLHLTATNLSLNLRKREFRKQHYQEKAAMEQEKQENGGDKSSWSEISPFVDELLVDLPSQQRQSIHLRYFEGKTENEIATLMDCSRNTVASWLRRGLEKLRSGFKKKGVVLSSVALVSILGQQSQAATVPVILSQTILANALGQELTKVAVTQILTEYQRGIFLAKIKKTLAGIAVLALLVTSACLVAFSNTKPPENINQQISASTPLDAKNASKSLKTVKSPKPVVPSSLPTIDVDCLVLGEKQYQLPGIVSHVDYCSEKNEMAAVARIGYEQQTLFVVDLNTGEQRQLKSVEGMITQIKYLDEGKSILIAQHPYRIRKNPSIVLWDVLDNRKIRSFNVPGYSQRASFALGPDETTLYIPISLDVYNQLKSGEFSKKVSARVLEKYQKLNVQEQEKFLKRIEVELEKFKEFDKELTLLENYQKWRVQLEMPRFASKAANNPSQDLLGLDLKTGKTLYEIKNVTRQIEHNRYHVTGIAASPNQTKICLINSWSGGSTKHIKKLPVELRIYEIPSGKMLLQKTMSKRFGYRNMSWLDQDRILIQGASSLIINAENGDLLKKLPGKCFIGPKGKEIISLQKGKIKFYNSTSYEQLDGEIAIVNGFIINPRISANDRWLYGVVNGSNSFLLVDLDEYKVVSPGKGPRNTADWMGFASNGDLLIAAGHQTTWRYDSVTGRIITQFPTKMYCRSNKCISADNKLLTSGGQKGGAELLDASTGKRLLTLKKQGEINRMWMSPDGKMAATQGTYNRILTFHNLSDGQTLGQIKGANVITLAWSATNDMVYLKSYIFSRPNEKNKPKSFNGAFSTKTGECFFRFLDTDGDRVKSISDISFCDSNNLLYLKYPVFDKKSESKYPKKLDDFYGLYDGANGELIRKLPKIDGPAHFSKDGQLLISPNGAVDTKTGEWVWRHEKGKQTSQDFISPSRQWLVKIIKSNSLKVYNAETGELTGKYHLKFPENLNLDVKILVWHPDERQVAIALKNQAEVLLVEFPGL